MDLSFHLVSTTIKKANFVFSALLFFSIQAQLHYEPDFKHKVRLTMSTVINAFKNFKYHIYLHTV